MGKWNINDLDKSKTEQSIANEEARLDYCREERERLIRERDKFKNDTDIKMWEYYDKIEKLTSSIDCGETFVKECKEHLKDFENAEGN